MTRAAGVERSGEEWRGVERSREERRGVAATLEQQCRDAGSRTWPAITQRHRLGLHCDLLPATVIYLYHHTVILISGGKHKSLLNSHRIDCRPKFLISYSNLLSVYI